MPKKIFIVSGGTGGHIIPAYCLAKFLLQKNHHTLLFGDKKVANYIKPNDKIKNFIISSSQFVKPNFHKPISSFFFLAKSLIKIQFGILQSLFFLLKERPDYVFAFGGYATFPMLVACSLTKQQIILHEQNAHLGKVNRLFAKFAYKIALSFEQTSGIKPEFLHKTIFTGNPIREEIIALNQISYSLPNFNDDFNEQEFMKNKFGYNVLLNSDFDNQDNKHNFFNILVIGGSGGAKIFSDILPKVFFNFPENIKKHIKIFQQCRPELVEKTFNTYQSFNINIEVNSFFEDMAELIREAHLIICRSGSSSIFEFCCANKPMIIVPFAKSADNHQQKNADFLEKNGAGIVIKEQDFTIQKVSDVINKLFLETDILFKMSRNAGSIAIKDATTKLSELIL